MMLLTHTIDGDVGTEICRAQARVNPPWRRVAWMILVCCGLWLAGCRPADAPPPALPNPTVPNADVALPPALSSGIEEAAPVLLQLERNAAATRDLATLAALWTEDARIVDGRNTPAPADDYVWSGHAAVMDRYRLAVFPVPPPPLDAPPSLDGMDSTPTHAVVVNGVDRWTFVHDGDRWYLQELVYQVP